MFIINKKNLLFVNQYSAPYTGNFIASSIELEEKLKKGYGCLVFYAFPFDAKDQPWFKEFSRLHKTFLIPDPPTSKDSLSKLIKELDIDIVHSHFDGYDVPIVEACSNIAKKIEIIWHLHNNLYFLWNPLKSLIIFWGYIKHYGLPFFQSNSNHNISAIYVHEHEKRFIRPFRLWKTFHREKIIPNGINTKPFEIRIPKKDSDIFTFLSYGGRSSQKRIDILIKAGILLRNKKICNFKIVITKGEDTLEILEQIFPNGIPSWIVLWDQTRDILNYLKRADCFVSCSKAETFSYAICEASIFGLPVIQSDIEGTKWNADNPSTFLFKNLDANDLAMRMKEVMSFPRDKMKRLTEETRNNNLSKYSLDVWTDNIIDFYKSM